MRLAMQHAESLNARLRAAGVIPLIDLYGNVTLFRSRRAPLDRGLFQESCASIAALGEYLRWQAQRADV